jgi:hypothetical protein
MSSSNQPNAEMAEAYSRDQKCIHSLRHAASALSVVLEDEECMADAQEYIGAKLKLERRAESLEATWD